MSARIRVFVLLFAVAGLVASGSDAAAITIDFSADAAGAVANGFSPIGHPGVHFGDSVGSGLAILDAGAASHGQALVVFGDTDGSVLAITFDQAVTSLSFEFGNDLASRTNPGDLAYLVVAFGGSGVAVVTMPLNRNGIMDQTISYSGGPIDAAFFAFTAPNGNPFTGTPPLVGLIEVVDNIAYEPVPEPASLLLLGTGLAALRLRRPDSDRRR